MDDLQDDALPRALDDVPRTYIAQPGAQHLGYRVFLDRAVLGCFTGFQIAGSQS